MTPDDVSAFRRARLLLVLAAAGEPLDAERLGVYEFLAGQPLLVARAGDDPDRTALRLAGFDDRAVAYASPAQRYVTAQLHLNRDLATLVAAGLVAVQAAGRVTYRLTEEGASMARRFTAMYAQSYITAVRIIVRRLRRMSGRKLRENLRQWLLPVPVKDVP
ncbi:hypothetical protein [Dactylosporangium matsuzakiense]|uniref:Uncharacterized protein n=1 Tax=Dactylosporangium matsuzakiense TaxID=53360 RepID=A0A9W6KK80_9ACTN|nr:hypothetical protein [Dactylosporangium matsuzakiense]UWZ47505.1 hypothetical protein Dmats_14515 [Dactylosporangium matsuzakiense]GLL01670.1 hypothetical protein GCM10017581_034120 [Dactylosporangium matsuzakiense]